MSWPTGRCPTSPNQCAVRQFFQRVLGFGLTNLAQETFCLRSANRPIYNIGARLLRDVHIVQCGQSFQPEDVQDQEKCLAVSRPTGDIRANADFSSAAMAELTCLIL
jgi:hypothetical protein